MENEVAMLVKALTCMIGSLIVVFGLIILGVGKAGHLPLSSPPLGVLCLVIGFLVIWGGGRLPPSS